MLTSFPFGIQINPPIQDPKTTYALICENQTVYLLNIVNQQFIPSAVLCLQSLKYFSIKNSNFDVDHVSQPASDIERLADSLAYLGILDTTITQLSTSFSKLKRLVTLGLCNTGLIALPATFSNLRSLSILYLSNNKLTSLPTFIGKMKSLTSINLDNSTYLRSI